MSVPLDNFVETVSRLIQNFDTHQTHYLSKGYLEAQARMDFITPFFKALGWDVENEARLSPHDREVIVERGETEGRPDYNFRLAGQTKFFVESKAPSESLDTTRHILQAKGYAWNTRQVFFVILTDFEEFRFYDASIRPDERKPDEGLLLKLRYADYLKNAQKLWEFSRERVAAGSLEAMLPRDRRTQRLRIPVDEAFLEEMTEWREELARNIFKNNRDLSAKQLNEVVQRLLDRIVFIRIAEDRNIIEKRQLADAVDEWRARGGKLHLFQWLNDLFHRINEDFNGEIFKPHLSETIQIDSEVLAKIIERLYPPKSPYRFDVIGVELLGSIYERYLGKTIRPTAKQVRVEDKPEVRKAGGVYYTPKYIVDYIVKNTVGKLIEGKTPKQIEKIRILDPACGSGSFLIGAFQYLIDYHVRYLTAHPKEAQVHPLYPDLIPDGNGGYRLSVRLKAKILRNNLYGVDIDPQAVEITMMSLYLKALEGEKSQFPPKQSLLPELKFNIICGNSLIGPDIYDQGNLFGEEEHDRINAFDWNSESAGFGRIMKEGGFDCVISNPPYGFHQIHDPAVKPYFRSHYRASQGSFEHYFLFYERSLGLLRKGGLHGFIVPVTWITIPSAKSLREFILDNYAIQKITWLPELVFKGAQVNTLISTIGRIPPRETVIEIHHKLGFLEPPAETRRSSQQRFIKADYFIGIFEQKSETGIIEKMLSCSQPLETVARPCSGYNPYEVGKGEKPGGGPHTKETVERKPYHSERKRGHVWKPEIVGRDLERYATNVTGQRWIKYGPWLAAARDPDNFRGKRILVQEITGGPSRRIIAAYFDGELYHSRDVIPIKVSGDTPNPFYLLGLINSQLMTWFHHRRNPKAVKQLFPKVLVSDLRKLPIRRLNLANSIERAHHNRMVTLVERMLELNERKHSGKLAPSQLDRVEREIAATDEKIDDLVYQLYGITNEERKIIESVRESRAPSPDSRFSYNAALTPDQKRW